MRWLVALMILISGCGCSGKKNLIFFEAESFTTKGGWVVDQQFMDIMGSPYLMAHGIGKIVDDAWTSFSVPATGKYSIWVRTKNWTAKFCKEQTPGIFKIQIDNKVLPFIYGQGKGEWCWEKGDDVLLEKGNSKIYLKDLTGFNGRVDAIFLTSDEDHIPPGNIKSLSGMRKKWLNLPEKTPSAGKYDLVVAGGGIAGICASVSAARLGLKVALIQDRPILGGNNSSEIQVVLRGKTQTGRFPALGSIVQELEPEIEEGITSAKSFEDSAKISLVKAEKNIRLFLNYHVFDAEVVENSIVAISAKNIETSRELLFEAPLFADCTGDANLGFLAGADYRVGSESKAQTGESRASDIESNQVLGAGLYWWSKDAGIETNFPDCPWAYQFNEESCQYVTKSSWNWESGFNQDMIYEFEEIRDNQLRSVFGNWSFQKNHSKRKSEYARMEIAELGYIMGKRESRRMLGDIIITQMDLDGPVSYPDGCVEITWGIDIHIPDPLNSKYFSGQEFRAVAIHPNKESSPPFEVPYRCFYSRNIKNLFMAGRHISTTHVAHAATRVQRNTGTYGEVVGIAASLCKKMNAEPRGIYDSYLEELKEALSTGVPSGK